MDYTPRSEQVRLLAMAAYLPLVGFFLLLGRRFRDVRLLRFHAYQGIGLYFLLLLIFLLSSLISTLLGGLPEIGLFINMLVGLLLVASLLAATVIGFYGAVMAYQGNYTGVPLLTEWVWMQVNGSGRPAPRKRRRIKRDAERSRPPAPEEEIF
ncbi:MAG TPA: hypothetical protein V6D47_05190 [Oscillatoriaceae cyanobacterium]